MHPLVDPRRSSAQRKLARGIEHINVLRDETRAFENSEAYVPRVERNVRSPQEIEYRLFAEEKEIAPPHWPLLAGEAVQNLRSALDHAVYAVSTRGKSRSQFPIFTDACEYQVKGKPRIAGVPGPIRTLIEARQPYNSLPTMPARDPLAILHALSNWDKHRTLATVPSLVTFPHVGLRSGVEVEFIQFPTRGQSLQGGAEIERFIARSDAPIGDMDVDPRFSFEVGIKGGKVMVFLVPTLVTIAKRVFEAVTEIETAKPISPGAAYPIYE